MHFATTSPPQMKSPSNQTKKMLLLLYGILWAGLVIALEFKTCEHFFAHDCKKLMVE